jgi:hypothetical protein
MEHREFFVFPYILRFQSVRLEEDKRRLIKEKVGEGGVGGGGGGGIFINSFVEDGAGPSQSGSLSFLYSTRISQKVSLFLYFLTAHTGHIC